MMIVISLWGNGLLILAIIGTFCVLILRSKDLLLNASIGTVSISPISISPAPWQTFGRTNSKVIVFYTSSIATVIAFLLLVKAFIDSNFALRNVFLNSSTIKPLIYKIAGSWASHEGSMLLYLAFLSVVSLFYVKLANYPRDVKNLQVTILAFIQLLFLSFTYLTSNPFDSFKFIPEQGLGLNPALQDKALSIHPPMLYLGYVLYVATYVNGLLLLLKPDAKEIILRNNLFFSSLALMALTAGIGLGSWWAYRELGWGGYWFFDPVENISLMPWLVGIALHHFILITIKTEKLSYLTIFSSIFTFLLTIYGIFFVRSGIVSSIHSFAFSPERGLYLLIICGILTAGAVLAFVIHNKVKKQSITSVSFREKFKYRSFYQLMIANSIWLAASILLLIALIYPVYYWLIYQREVAIDPEFFYMIFVPLFIPLMLLAGTSVNIHRLNFKLIIFALISVLSVFLVAHYVEKLGMIMAGLIFASVFLIAQMIDFTLVHSNFFKQAMPMNKLALITGHVGLALLALTITLNVLFAKEFEFTGKVGDTLTRDSFMVKLNNVKFADSVVYYRQIAEFSVTDDKGYITILKPENRLYKIEQSLSQESDIYSYLTHDMFAVLSKINGEVIHAIIYYRPLIFFIWLSVSLISIAFGIYLWGLFAKPGN